MIRRLFRRAPDWYDEASAFVDGELAPEREAAFSRELAGSVQLQHYVAELQATKAALAALPQLEVPRPFTISIAQAQGSPAMTRRQSVERTAPRAAGLLEGTLLMRGAATFSAVAIAALAAVVIVDVSQSDGDSQIFRDFAAVGQVASDGADDQAGTRGETAVAALQAEQAADQSTQAQAQAASLAPRLEEQAEAQAAQAVPEPATAELESEADAAADTETQTLTDAGEAPVESESAPASEQAADQATSDEGDPAIAAVAGSDDTTAEDPTPDAQADTQAPAEAEAEAEAEAATDAGEGTAELPVDAEAAGPPIEQGTSGGQAEETDLARAADQSEAGAPPTIEPTAEAPAPTEATDEAADDAADEATADAVDETAADATDEAAADAADEPTDGATAAATATASVEASAGDDSEPTAADEEAVSEAPRPGTTLSATNRTGQADDQAPSEAASAEPEGASPVAALAHDESEVIQILEIVLGIAAGLSVLTLLVTLYRRRV